MKHHKYIYAFAYQEHGDIQNTVWLIRIKTKVMHYCIQFVDISHVTRMKKSHFDPFIRNGRFEMKISKKTICTSPPISGQ